MWPLIFPFSWLAGRRWSRTRSWLALPGEVLARKSASHHHHHVPDGAVKDIVLLMIYRSVSPSLPLSQMSSSILIILHNGGPLKATWPKSRVLWYAFHTVAFLWYFSALYLSMDMNKYDYDSCVAYGCFPLMINGEQLWCFSSLTTESWNVPSSNPFVTPTSSFYFIYGSGMSFILSTFMSGLWDLLNLMLRHMQDRWSPYIITFDWQEVQILLLRTNYTEIISLLLLWMLKCISDPIRKQFFL